VVETFFIITTAVNPMVAAARNRMPVIIPENQFFGGWMPGNSRRIF
jgi:putative SOS response-associated peptidase YedK